jgi:hypothetical protein
MTLSVRVFNTGYTAVSGGPGWDTARPPPEAVAALEPRTIIAGHKDPDGPDDDAIRQLAQSRRYIEDFEYALQSSGSASQLIDTMMSSYRTYGNPYTLFLSAHSQFT